MIIFAVPKELMAKAIGPNASNIHYLQEKLGKRIRIIREASGTEDAQRFMSDIVAPVRFKSLDMQDGVFVLTAGMQSKAALLGRNKRRYDELRQIVQDTFSIDLRIV
jgi:transcription antitermination factor NusA-like protein